MSDNIIAQALSAADERHFQNPVIQALASKLRIAQASAIGARLGDMDSLIAFRRGAEGQDGYGLMFTIEPSTFQPILREISALREVAVIADCLASALNAVGENILY